MQPSISTWLSEGFSFFKKHYRILVLTSLALYLLNYFILKITSSEFISNLIGSFIPFLICFTVFKLDSDSTYNLLSKPNEIGKFLKPLIITSIIFDLSILGLSLLFIIPGIIFLNYWSFFALSVFDQNLSGKKALDHSKSLIKGHWWLVFSIGIFEFFAFLAIYLITYFFGSFSPITENIYGIVTTYFLVVMFTAYKSLKS